MRRLFETTHFILVIILTLANPGWLFADATQDLHDAIKKGDYEKFKAAIAAGADVNAYDAAGNTPLLNAIGHPAMVKDLLAAKADANKFNKTNMFSPLISACSFGSTDVVKDLIAAGASANAADAFVGNSPLFSAMMGGLSMEGIKLLIEKGADSKHMNSLGQNLLDAFAAGATKPEVRAIKMKDAIAYYRNAGMAVPPLLESTPDNLSTLEERLDFILSYGFNVNQELPQRVPPTTPNAETINKQNEKSGLKNFPLLIALNNYSGRVDMIRLLVSRGADPKKLYGKGGSGSLNRTLLHVLALQGDRVGNDKQELVKLLVESGIGVDETDGAGYTALILAAKFGNTSFIKALLPHNPNLNVKQKDTEWYTADGSLWKKTFRTAMDWAAEAKHVEAYNLIKAAGGKGASK